TPKDAIKTVRVEFPAPSIALWTLEPYALPVEGCLREGQCDPRGSPLAALPTHSQLGGFRTGRSKSSASTASKSSASLPRSTKNYIAIVSYLQPSFRYSGHCGGLN